MKVLLFIGVMLFVSLPVRLASYWFKSERQGWGISFAVIILGAMLVSAISFYAPGLWRASQVVRLGVAFLIFLILSSVMLGMKPWQAAILALFIACVYSFGASPVHASPSGAQASSCCSVQARAMPRMPPNHAVNTDAHRRRFAPWWSPVTLIR